jgi:hypothetical protein
MRPESPVIHIVREDNIEWLKSKYLSSRTGFFANKSYPHGEKIRIPLGSAARRLRAKCWVEQRLSTLEESNPYIKVSYEHFLVSKTAVLDCILQLLDCSTPETGEIDLPVKKQSKGTAADYISNYDELVKRLESLAFI